jgi:hypothetical protein
MCRKVERSTVPLHGSALGRRQRGEHLQEGSYLGTSEETTERVIIQRLCVCLFVCLFTQ